MSRKMKLTEQIWEIIVGGVRDGYTITDACAMANVGRSTFYKWLEKYPDFNKAIVEATDLQWKYAYWRVRNGYRGYKRPHLVRPSKDYQSPGNVPFEIPSVESNTIDNVLNPNNDESLWWKLSMDNAY